MTNNSKKKILQHKRKQEVINIKVKRFFYKTMEVYNGINMDLKDLFI